MEGRRKTRAGLCFFAYPAVAPQSIYRRFESTWRSLLHDDLFPHIYRLTPAYNRAATLHRPYALLRAQTMRDFEWLIVDDGSEDGTRSLVEAWQKEAKFPIRYRYQSNAGKPGGLSCWHSNRTGRASSPSTLTTAAYRTPWSVSCSTGTASRRAAGLSSAPLLPCARIRTGSWWVQCSHPIPLDSDSIELVYKYRVKGREVGISTHQCLKRVPVSGRL